LLLVLLSATVTTSRAMEVVMVIGGRYLDHGRQSHVELSSVEVIGPRGGCRIPDMPEPRHGHTAGVVGNNVYVCGGLSGKHIHERQDCLVYSLAEGEWTRLQAPAPKGLAFSSVAVSGNSFYLVGGRESLYKSSQDRPWESSGVVMEFSTIRGRDTAWRFLPNMTKPGSDGCAGVGRNQLWYVGDKGVEMLGVGEDTWKPAELTRVRNQTLERILSGLDPNLNPVLTPILNQGLGSNMNPKPGLAPAYQPKYKADSGPRRGSTKLTARLGPRPAGSEQEAVLPFNLDPLNNPLGGNRVNTMNGIQEVARQKEIKLLQEERRRHAEEERRKKNLQVLDKQKKPGSIWDQIRTVFDKGSRGVDDIFNKDEDMYRRRKRQVTRAPWAENMNLPTRAPWSDQPKDVRTDWSQQPKVVRNEVFDARGNTLRWNTEVDQRTNGKGQDRDLREGRRQGRKEGRGQPSYSNRGGDWSSDTNRDWRDKERKDTTDSSKRKHKVWRKNRKKEKKVDPTRPSLGGSEAGRRRPEEKMVGQGCACAVTTLNGEEGIVVAGGVWQGGRKVAWVPLNRPGPPLIEEIGPLKEARRWRPGVGRIAGQLVVLGGGDWGSSSVEVLHDNNRFKLLEHGMEDRRENTAAVTVDSSFFEGCDF